MYETVQDLKMETVEIKNLGIQEGTTVASFTNRMQKDGIENLKC